MEKSVKNVKVYIDGREVEVPETATILDAAKIAGADVPTLCYHPALDPLGACRVCLVEVEGSADPVASCNTFVIDQMKITTSSPRLIEARQKNLKLILINHPLECPVCDKGGECELQRIVFELGTTDEILTIEKIEMKIDRASPLIARYDTRCIRCGRCIAVCEQIRGFGAYEFYDTGYEARVRPKTGERLDCEFCGACVDVCPVGTILSTMFLHKERGWNLKKTPSVCGQCGSACAILNETKRGLVYRAKPDLSRHRYKGQMCHRGYFGYDYPHNPKRILLPQKRAEGKSQHVLSARALNELVNEIRAIRDEHGAGSIGFVVSERLSNEELITISELANRLGVKHVGSLADFGPSKVLGDSYRPYITATFEDVAPADTVIIAGDFEYEMPSAALRVVEADHNDAHIVRISCRKGKLSKFAKENYSVLPGDEAAFLWGVARALLDMAQKQIDVENARAIDELKARPLSDWTAPLGINESNLISLAARILAGERLVLVLGRNLQFGPLAESAVSAAALILELAGKAKSAGSGILLSIDRANLRGVLEFLNGFDNFWDALQAGNIKAVISFDADPLLEFPLAHSALKFDNLDFVCAITMFDGPFVKKAGLVIPSKATSEKSGTVLAADGCVVDFERALSGPEQAISTFEIANEIAQRILGDSLFDSVMSATVKAKEILQKNKDKSAKLRLVSPALPQKASEGKLKMAFGSELFHVGRFTPYATGPTTLVPASYIALSEAMAEKMQIAPGQKVTLMANGASVTAPAKIDNSVMDGAVFVPESFSEPPFYLLLEGSFVAEVELAR